VLLVILFFVLHWYLSLFSQTFFLHRYAAHKMFSMNKFWEKFFYAFTYIAQGSSYLTPRAYAVLHRMHHAYSDTEKDPHSPHHSGNALAMMWKTKEIYEKVYHRIFNTEPEFDRNYPEIPWIDKLGENMVSRIGWGTAYALVYIAAFIWLQMPWWMFFFLPVHWLMGPIHGAIVNWSGHKYGYANFDNNDKSKNTLIVDFLCMGELFQNNHHKLPNRPKFSVKWFELDPTYMVMWVLNLFHIIRINPVHSV
jgi:stearoyl-CoA desaturase (delta-9 desaturase)